MTNYAKARYFTGWQYDNDTRKSSHRIYYNDIDIATWGFRHRTSAENRIPSKQSTSGSTSL